METAASTSPIVPETANILEPIFYFVYRLFSGAWGSVGSAEDALLVFLSWWNAYSVAAYLFSAAIAVIVIYATVRINQIEEMEREDIRHAEEERAVRSSAKNARWMDIQNHSASVNPNDWKVAIIEADIMLDELLSKLGYVGFSIGEKLKDAPSGAFASLNDAWDAHRVRNSIAHEGSDFVLTHRMTRETIEKYRRVFNEFGVI